MTLFAYCIEIYLVLVSSEFSDSFALDHIWCSFRVCHIGLKLTLQLIIDSLGLNFGIWSDSMKYATFQMAKYPYSLISNLVVSIFHLIQPPGNNQCLKIICFTMFYRSQIVSTAITCLFIFLFIVERYKKRTAHYGTSDNLLISLLIELIVMLTFFQGMLDLTFIFGLSYFLSR